MNGRMLFKYFSFLIWVVSACFKMLPSFVAWFLWDLVSPFGGKVAVLLRYCIVSGRAKHFGKNIYFGKTVVLKNPAEFSVGNNVSIHDSCYLDAIGGLKIGADVSIAHQTSIITFNHTWSDMSQPIKYNPIEKAPSSLKMTFGSAAACVSCPALSLANAPSLQRVPLSQTMCPRRHSCGSAGENYQEYRMKRVLFVHDHIFKYRGNAYYSGEGCLLPYGPATCRFSFTYRRWTGWWNSYRRGRRVYPVFRKWSRFLLASWYFKFKEFAFRPCWCGGRLPISGG